MTGICWRLLAIFSLIFFLALVAPALMPGQDAAAERSPASRLAPGPNLSQSRNSSPTAPVWIPPPSIPRPYPSAPGTLGLQQNLFQQLARAAGIIFSGRVTSIGHAKSSSGPDPVSTAVTFQVEHAMRGASAGQNLTIHEWAGLWGSGERYRVGERVLLFLYPPGRLGFTSTVAGAMGRFAIDSQGKVVMNAQHVATLAADPILGGKTVVPYADFALAVRSSSRKE
jgi:hypothetical protein